MAIPDSIPEPIGYVYDHETYCSVCNGSQREAFEGTPDSLLCVWDDQPVRLYDSVRSRGYETLPCTICGRMLIQEIAASMAYLRRTIHDPNSLMLATDYPALFAELDDFEVLPELSLTNGRGEETTEISYDESLASDDPAIRAWVVFGHYAEPKAGCVRLADAYCKEIAYLLHDRLYERLTGQNIEPIDT